VVSSMWMQMIYAPHLLSKCNVPTVRSVIHFRQLVTVGDSASLATGGHFGGITRATCFYGVQVSMIWQQPRMGMPEWVRPRRHRWSLSIGAAVRRQLGPQGGAD